MPKKISVIIYRGILGESVMPRRAIDGHSFSRQSESIPSESPKARLHRLRRVRQNRIPLGRSLKKTTPHQDHLPFLCSVALELCHYRIRARSVVMRMSCDEDNAVCLPLPLLDLRIRVWRNQKQRFLLRRTHANLQQL